MKNKPKNQKEKPASKETLEGEIKKAVEKEKEFIEEGQKIAEEQKVDEIKQEAQPYKKIEASQEKYKQENEPQTDSTKYQEFYVKNKEDFDTIKSTVQEIKAQDPATSKVQDSDLYELDPETKKLKLKSMSRQIIEKLKAKRVNLDFYNM